MEEFSARILAEEWVTLRQSCQEIARCAALEQGVFGRENATSVAQPDRHYELPVRVKEFDGYNDKLLAEYQQDTESDPPGEFRQELKGRVADSLRVCLHAE